MTGEQVTGTEYTQHPDVFYKCPAIIIIVLIEHQTLNRIDDNDSVVQLNTSLQPDRITFNQSRL